MSSNAFTAEQTDRLKEYAALVQAARIAQEKVDSLKPHVLADFDLAGVDKAAIPGVGALSVSVRHNYQFSPAVAQKEDELEALKTKEKQDGTATDKPTKFVTFRAEKAEKEE